LEPQGNPSSKPSQICFALFQEKNKNVRATEERHLISVLLGMCRSSLWHFLSYNRYGNSGITTNDRYSVNIPANKNNVKMRLVPLKNIVRDAKGCVTEGQQDISDQSKTGNRVGGHRHRTIAYLVDSFFGKTQILRKL
jgi:hypothetical protein